MDPPPSVENIIGGTLENKSIVENISGGTLENNSSVENDSGGTLENKSGDTIENEQLVLIRLIRAFQSTQFKSPGGLH